MLSMNKDSYDVCLFFQRCCFQSVCDILETCCSSRHKDLVRKQADSLYWSVHILISLVTGSVLDMGLFYVHCISGRSGCIATGQGWCWNMTALCLSIYISQTPVGGSTLSSVAKLSQHCKHFSRAGAHLYWWKTPPMSNICMSEYSLG